MTQIQLPSGCYLLMEIPQEAKDFVIDDELFYKAFYMGLENIAHMKKLPSGQWSIIGKADEIGEDDWGKIVSKFHNGAVRDYAYKYFDPADELIPFCLTNVESGLSLIASHNMKPETTLILKKIQP